MASRCSGPTIACKEAMGAAFILICVLDNAELILRKGLSQRHRLVLRL